MKVDRRAPPPFGELYVDFGSRTVWGFGKDEVSVSDARPGMMLRYSVRYLPGKTLELTPKWASQDHKTIATPTGVKRFTYEVIDVECRRSIVLTSGNALTTLVSFSWDELHSCE